MADRNHNDATNWGGSAVGNPGESSVTDEQKARSVQTPSREQAISDRVFQMPKASVSTYLKATRGKASPRVAIKAFCMECVGWNRTEVTKCTALACPLWMYRPFQREGRDNG